MFNFCDKQSNPVGVNFKNAFLVVVAKEKNLFWAGKRLTNNSVRAILRKFLMKVSVFPLPSQWRRSGVSIVNFKHISHLVLVFLLLTLNM